MSYGLPGRPRSRSSYHLTLVVKGEDMKEGFTSVSYDPVYTIPQ